MYTILKVFTEFVTIRFLFYVWVFWPQGMWKSQLLEQGSNLYPLRWKAKTYPLDRQGSPSLQFSSHLFLTVPPTRQETQLRLVKGRTPRGNSWSEFPQLSAKAARALTGSMVLSAPPASQPASPWVLLQHLTEGSSLPPHQFSRPPKP